MCHFVPGQVVALGFLNELYEISDGLPGSITIRPLYPEDIEIAENNSLFGLGTLTLNTDPGMEIFALSQLSARLAQSILKEKAAVDLNHILPWGSENTLDYTSRLSSHAEHVSNNLRKWIRHQLEDSRQLLNEKTIRIAMLDSGLNVNYSAHRKVNYFDYSFDGSFRKDTPQTDPTGHGTLGLVKQ